MWQFLNQYGWYFLIFGLMFFMHRRGAGGCCGGHQHDQHGKQDQHNQLQRPLRRLVTGSSIISKFVYA